MQVCPLKRTAFNKTDEQEALRRIQLRLNCDRPQARAVLEKLTQGLLAGEKQRDLEVLEAFDHPEKALFPDARTETIH